MREFIEALAIAAISGVIEHVASHYIEAWIDGLRKRHHKKPAHKKLRPH